MTVMSAVCVLLGVKPDWASAKHILADPQFLRKLVGFDKSAVSDKVLDILFENTVLKRETCFALDY